MSTDLRLSSWITTVSSNKPRPSAIRIVLERGSKQDTIGTFSVDKGRSKTLSVDCIKAIQDDASQRSGKLLYKLEAVGSLNETIATFTQRADGGQSNTGQDGINPSLVSLVNNVFTSAHHHNEQNFEHAFELVRALNARVRELETIQKEQSERIVKQSRIIAKLRTQGSSYNPLLNIALSKIGTALPAFLNSTKSDTEAKEQPLPPHIIIIKKVLERCNAVELETLISVVLDAETTHDTIQTIAGDKIEPDDYPTLLAYLREKGFAK